MSFKITTATRKAAPVSVYIEGESGSGKTYSALLLARGLAGKDGKIGVIDTEGRRSLIYADDPDIGGFEHMHFEAPYSPDRFIEAMKDAVAADWKAIVIDSASLEHDGEGGLLESAEIEYEAILKRNPQNKAANQQKWTKPKLAHRRFLTFSTGLPCHIIMCFRQVLTTDFKAKPNPVTVKSPVVEKNTKFFLELHAEIGSDHKAHWTRVPKPYLSCIKNDAPISRETGQLLAESANVGKEPTAEPDPIAEIELLIEQAGLTEEQFNRGIKLAYKGKHEAFRELPPTHLEALAKVEGFNKIEEKAREIIAQEGGQAA